jgi:cell wall-associated NlpC family hydrolase
MPRYAAEQIYGFARRAGFTPDEAATMTAIALAESGGNSRAHNPHGEDSRGLWQINGRAHPGLVERFNLYDPQDNAKAAFLVSRKGEDISPWTVTHGGNSARYLRYKDDAQNAAVAYGDGPGRGVWTGTPGYGHPVAASRSDSGTNDDLQANSGSGDNAALETFLRVAKAQVGDPYVFGAEVKLKDDDPDVFDCSEFTQWAAHQAGAKIPDGATAQYLHLKERGLLIPVDKAKDTPGALLFSFDREPRPGDGRTPGAHVAISLGDGKIVEAANRRAGVRESTAGERFEYAAVIPGISDGTATPLAEPTPPSAPIPMPVAEPIVAPPPPELGGPDSDRDGLSDALERRMGLDPLRADTDADNLTDAQELITYGTDGRKADTDGDRLNDAFELAQGLNPLSPDTDADGHLDGSLAPLRTDADADGLDDALEQVIGLKATLADSDSDGFSDGLEYRSGSSAANPLDNPLMHRGAAPQPGTGQPGIQQAGQQAAFGQQPGLGQFPGADPLTVGQLPGTGLPPVSPAAGVAPAGGTGAGTNDDPVP